VKVTVPTFFSRGLEKSTGKKVQKKEKGLTPSEKNEKIKGGAFLERKPVSEKRGDRQQNHRTER